MPARSMLDSLTVWYGTRPLVRAVVPGVLLVGLGSVAFGGLLDAVQEQDDLSLLDRPVLEFLVGARTGAVTGALAALTFVTGPSVLPWIVLVACVLWGQVRREWWRPLLLAAAMAGSTVISVAVKGLVARPRPPEETMYIPGAETTGSFPSGHTIGTATFLLVMGYLVASRHRTRKFIVGWTVGAVVGMTAVALSRLYLGYHFLTDVLAAVALAVTVVGVVTVLDRVHVVHGLPPQEPEPNWSPEPTTDVQSMSEGGRPAT